MQDQLQSCCYCSKKMPRHQEPRDQDTKTPRQDKAEVLALLCLLAWMDLAWKDGLELCLDWIGNSVQDSQETPQGVRKVQYIQLNTIQYIHICAKSIHIHEKENTFTFPIQIIFQEKFFSLLVFIFKFNFLKHPINFTGR